MYKVLNHEFATFEEVIAWAWNEHKIDAHCDPQDEEEKQIACEELSCMVAPIEAAEEVNG